MLGFFSALVSKSFGFWSGSLLLAEGFWSLGDLSGFMASYCPRSFLIALGFMFICMEAETLNPKPASAALLLQLNVELVSDSRAEPVQQSQSDRVVTTVDDINPAV